VRGGGKEKRKRSETGGEDRLYGRKEEIVGGKREVDDQVLEVDGGTLLWLSLHDGEAGGTKRVRIIDVTCRSTH